MSRRTRSHDRDDRQPNARRSARSDSSAQRGGGRRTAEARSDPDRVEGEALEPIGIVERELTRPDGTTVVVEVPVYPPFRLKERPPGGRPAAPPRQRGAPSLRRRKASRSSGDAR